MNRQFDTIKHFIYPNCLRKSLNRSGNPNIYVHFLNLSIYSKLYFKKNKIIHITAIKSKKLLLIIYRRYGEKTVNEKSLTNQLYSHTTSTCQLLSHLFSFLYHNEQVTKLIAAVSIY